MDQAIKKKILPFMNDEYYHKNLCKGSTKTRYIKIDHLKVRNKFILALLYAFDCKTVDLANYCGVTQKSVDTWIYKDATPNYVNMCKITFYFNMQQEILFSHYASMNPQPIKDLLIKQGNTGRHDLTAAKRKVDKPLIFGLIWLYQINLNMLANEMGLSLKMIQRILYTDKKPKEIIKDKFETIFQIPKEILFMPDLRARTAERRALSE